MRLARTRAGLLIVWVCSAALSTDAAVIYVDDSAVGDNTGTSWQDGYVDLQDGLAEAKAGDELRVAQGAYKPTGAGGPREATFNLTDGVIVQGGYAGFGAADSNALDPDTYVTLLSGDLNGDDGALGSFENYGENSYNVVTANGVSAATELRGVTVRGGSADLFQGCSPFEGFDTGGA